MTLTCRYFGSCPFRDETERFLLLKPELPPGDEIKQVKHA